MIKSHSEKVLEHANPSQITTFSSCACEWHGEKAEGCKPPSTHATELGMAVHTCVERYLAAGGMHVPDTKLFGPLAAQASQIALRGLKLLEADNARAAAKAGRP